MSVAFSVKRARAAFAGGLAAILAVALTAAAAQAAPPRPEEDPFYQYTGSTPLSSISPGTVLKTRTTLFHVAGIPLPVKAVQLLYRSTGPLGQPEVNVTSVLEPLGGPPLFAPVIAYQSFYDSLKAEDEPSYAISGGEFSSGREIDSEEAALIAPALLAGIPIVIADTEGQPAYFADGPEYGMNTLDSLRAALSSPATGLWSTLEIGLAGYSGGAIATEWAAELAPTYAPEIAKKIVGATFGGTLVDPAHNLRYVEGSSFWTGVIPMAIIGVARAYHINITPYLTPYGLELFNKLQRASIGEATGHYPGLTWSQLVKPEYPTPESIPAFVEAANKLIMGTGGTPNAPLFIAQGAGGESEGTPGNKPGIGPGDGVMIAGDVRSLANEYCSRGVRVLYHEYPTLAHTPAALQWLPEAYAWLGERFASLGGLLWSAPSSCGSIAPGNPLTPLP